MINLLLIALSIILLLFICREPERESFINAKVVDQPADIQRGLMYIKNPLPDDTGMLFDFGHNAKHNMWMKNTYIPLDMVFLNENKKVLGFVENTTPLKEKVVGINKPSRYVLETNSGWVKNNEIKVGDPIDINEVKSLKIS